MTVALDALLCTVTAPPHHTRTESTDHRERVIDQLSLDCGPEHSVMLTAVEGSDIVLAFGKTLPAEPQARGNPLAPHLGEPIERQRM